jgi:hypothetical protein
VVDVDEEEMEIKVNCAYLEAASVAVRLEGGSTILRPQSYEVQRTFKQT